MVQRREALLTLYGHQVSCSRIGWHGKGKFPRFWHKRSFSISPTLEEFQALMESFCNEEIMLQPRLGYARALERMCGLTLY
ncbi:hypothetical protein CsSME_00020011 [Camellia sinensis var. sinensis]